ncbi:TrmH family RNA methyltransferase [Bosea sp. AS-1]|uniref:tRNA (cytidine(34)-2'-O)-methyltransferase n=1 Tax=Bosea sp. AS-1 TaxID=2015316 RepID=UPI000B76E595|nr:TrmH family RNA methyltransferase [Bosea sp. AS-1]
MTETSLRLALFQPDIPQNAGTMLRMAACLGLGVDIVEPAAFDVSDRHFRRSGMDYLERAAVMRHDSFRTFEEWRRAEGRRLVLAETDGATALPDFAFRPSDIVMVGRESAGVTAEVRNAAGASLHIPMRPGLRSINVALAAAMVMGEALRQTGGFPGRQEADRTDHEHAPPR